MTTNFFSLMASLSATGNIILTINLDNPQELKVLVYHADDEQGKNKGKAIEPLIFKATPAALDEFFFADIEEPVKATESLRLLNKEAHLKAVEAAKNRTINNSTSPSVTTTKSEPKKIESPADKKFNNAMQVVEELKGKERYREAIGKLPSHTEFPDKEETIKQTKVALISKMEEKEFTTSMQVVEDLKSKGRYKEAIGKLPSISEYPDKEDFINNMKAGIMAKLEENTLFAA